MIQEPKGVSARWQRSVVLSVRGGKLQHSGQARPLRVRKANGGLFIGCTFVTHAALQLIAEKSKK